MHKWIGWGIALSALCLTAAGGFSSGVQYARQSAQEAPPAAVYAEPDAIEIFRTDRQQLRQMQLSQLSEIIHGSEAESEIVALAQRRQMELMEWSEHEQTLEGVLALRGFQDAVVTVHTDSVNVMVRAESVSSGEAAVILELVTRETGISGGNVKIIPIN